MSIQITEFTKDDEYKILDVFNAVFAQENADHVDMDKSIWNWKYRNSPHGFKILVAKDENGNVVGQISLRAEKVKFFDKTVIVYSIMDMCILPQGRKQGFVKKCYEYIVATGNPAWGFSIDVLRNISVARELNTQDFDICIFHKDISQATNNANVSVSPPTTYVANDIEMIWAEKSKEVSICHVRDWQYIKWAVLDAPHSNKLYFLYDKNQKLIGYFALRDKDDMCMVVDIFVLNEYMTSDVMSAIEYHCRQLGYSSVQIFVTDKLVQSILRQNKFSVFSPDQLVDSGFFRYKDPQDKPVEISDFYLTWIASDWDLYEKIR